MVQGFQVHRFEVPCRDVYTGASIAEIVSVKMRHRKEAQLMGSMQTSYCL